MSKIEGNARDAFAQFFLADKLWMKPSQMPDNGRDVIHALVVGHNDQRACIRHDLCRFKGVTGTQQMGASHQAKVQPAHTFFMSLISKHVKAYTLNGVKDDQYQSETYEIQGRKGIRKDLLHAGTKIKKPPVRSGFS